MPFELNAIDNSCAVVAFWTRPSQRSAATAIRTVKNWMVAIAVGGLAIMGALNAAH